MFPGDCVKIRSETVCNCKFKYFQLSLQSSTNRENTSDCRWWLSLINAEL